MTEQELTALARDAAERRLDYTFQETALAQGYLAILAERNALKEKVALFSDLIIEARDERDALKEQLESTEAECDRLRNMVLTTAVSRVTP